MDDKEIILLAEKIRSNYSSLPENKEQVLEELLMSITNPLKKSRLLEALKRTLDRKGETLVGGTSNKEIAYVLQKIMKWLTFIPIHTNEISKMNKIDFLYIRLHPYKNIDSSMGNYISKLMKPLNVWQR